MLKMDFPKPGRVAHALSLNSQEAETGESIIQSQSGPHREFHGSGYLVTSCFKRGLGELKMWLSSRTLTSYTQKPLALQREIKRAECVQWGPPDSQCLVPLVSVTPSTKMLLLL